MARNTKLTKPDVIARINDLLNNNTGKYGKYQRNYSLYNQTIAADLRARVPETVGFFDDVYSDIAYFFRGVLDKQAPSHPHHGRPLIPACTYTRLW